MHASEYRSGVREAVVESDPWDKDVDLVFTNRSLARAIGVGLTPVFAHQADALVTNTRG